jgi:hypothetical protein
VKVRLGGLHFNTTKTNSSSISKITKAKKKNEVKVWLKQYSTYSAKCEALSSNPNPTKKKKKGISQFKSAI